MGEHTGVARRRVPELMAAVKSVADADPTAGGLILPFHKAQLDLELICVRVAGVCGLKDGAVVPTSCHEQLGSVVDLGELWKISIAVVGHKVAEVMDILRRQ